MSKTLKDSKEKKDKRRIPLREGDLKEDKGGHRNLLREALLEEEEDEEVEEHEPVDDYEFFVVE